MKKLVYLLIAVSLMLALVPAAALAHTEAEPFITDLIASGGNEKSAMDVGDVLVWNDGDTLYVKYVITETEWCITETHLQVAMLPGDIPQKNDNPIPGKFEENDEHDCVQEVLYTYDLTARGWNIDDELSIAAHAAVADIFGNIDANLDNFAANLPEQVTMSVQYPYSGGLAYFPVTTITGDPLTGIYEGWCVDTDNVIYQNTNYTANVYSSYEELPAGLVESPENLDLANWIINQGFVGQPSSGCSGNYTYGDVQRAIWALIKDQQSTSGIGPWSQCRVDEILAAAYTNGEGFVPECGDQVAVVLEPVGGQQVITIAQVTLVGITGECIPVQYETAWGAGIDFPGKNWATYFTYTVQPPYKFWNLPETAGLRIAHYPGWSNNYFDLQLSGVGTGYDISDGVWTGWCADEHVYIYLNTNYTADVYSSYDPNLPLWADDDEQWDYINYILNHKHPNASMTDIQQAIWYFADAGYPMPTDAEAVAMVNDALANGAGFQPVTGQVGAIILAVQPSVQLVFIEVDP